MRRQSSPRRVCPPSELPPLPVDGAPRRKQQRRRLVVSGSGEPDTLSSQDSGSHEASAGDDRSTGSRGPLPSCCSSPKAYPRLQTLAQLAGKYVRDLHLGDFVARSELRWRRFEGADAPNSARERAYDTVQDSGALVIQCAWRKHAALLTRKRLLAAIWRRQLQVAARISTRTAALMRVLKLADATDGANSRLVALAGALDMTEGALPVYGLYYHAPATLLAWWLGYVSAKTVGRRFLRRPPVILRTVDLPVRQACRTLARLWRSIVPLATLTIQCCVRVFIARQLLGRRRLQRLRQAAAVQLQGFVRVCNAQHLAVRVRRRCAAVRVQCFWRRHRARKCLRHQRIARTATRFCAPLLLQAARQATVKLREVSALKIQKQYRGSRARAQFRGLLGLNEQQKWRKNPSRGFLFFTQKRYDLAALFLETCFRQGLFQGDPRPGPLPQQGEVSWADEAPTSAKPRRKVASGSRMSFSFSAAPTKLGTDWILQGEGNGTNDIEATSGAADLAARLRFWQTYAISHFQVFEATGDVLNLHQARVGWESYLRVDAMTNSWPALRGSVAGALQELRARSSLGLVQCLFWGGKHSDRDQALALSLKLLEEQDRDSTDDDVKQEAQLLMISSMLYFEQTRYACSCAQLEKLLLLPQQTTFTDVEIRFTLALVLRRRFEASCSEGQGADRASDPEGATLLRTAAQLLKQCYRAIELWPAVGFYHGWLRKSDAKRLLETEPVGAFLLFHALDVADASGKRSGVESTSPEGKLLLQVKTSDRPLRLASLRIEFSTDTGVYRTRKLPSHRGHFSLHGFVASLPTAAGVKMELGVRKRLHSPPLRTKLEQTTQAGVGGYEKEALRALLLPWSEWERQLTKERELFFSPRADSRWKRRSETWSAVCFEMAQALEGSQAWLFAEAAAREALAHSRARAHRANVCFLAARVSLNVQKRMESALFMQQARLEKASRQPSAIGALFITNLTAVQRALSPNVSLSKQEPFAARLERVQKLERMCLKAWRFDSLASNLRGDALREATLLQCIDDEAYATCSDTFFTRSLLKAHVRAYLVPGVYEERHLKCAFRCVVRLFERFHTLQSSWPEQLTDLTGHFGDKSLRRGPPKPRAFTVSLLLLSWHHMPFLICFELSEVLYRSSIVAVGRKSRSPSPLIDVYESLLGRLRGSQPRTDVYASYEELLLLRLAFLHAAKATQVERSWRHLGSAIASIDEILTQRKLRARTGSSATVRRQAKAINWPCSIRLPLALSDAEVAFIRGFFTEMREDLLQVPVGQRDSWRDYHALHEEVLELVKQLPPPGQASGGRMLNSVRSRVENLQGLRIFLGASQHVKSANLLRSQPFVAIRHEGATSVSQTPPYWTNLSPSWAEDVEIPVNSPHATISISLMDRTRRATRWQDDEVVGSVSLAMQELLAAPDGVTEGKFYDLKAATAHAAAGPSVRLFLSFQVLVKPTQALPPSASRTAAWATRRGNWDVEDVRTHLHGDFRAFVASRWIWSRFANVFVADQDLCIAKWFFSKAVRLTPTLQRRTSVQGVRLNLKESLEIAMDLVGLCRCYRACLGESRWGEQAAPLLAQAEGLLARSSAQPERDYASTWLRPALEKQLAVVRGLMEETRGDRRIGSLEEALRQKTLASSVWLKLTSVDPISRELRTRYLNQDTGGSFHSNWRTEPLEYEDKQLLLLTEDQPRLPHRIVIMTGEMRARVTLHRQKLLRLHTQDPYQWTAVFNERKQEVEFFSPHFPDAFVPPSDCYSAQPPTYAMLADDFLLYHALLVQDAYRKFHRRRRRQRRVRGLLKTAFYCVLELLVTRRRLFLRSDAIRKRSLNRLHVVVHRASHLRAGDLLTSDPYVIMTLTDATGEVAAADETSVRYNSLNPKWDEEFLWRYSFVDHERQQTAARSLEEEERPLQDAVLTLRVFDFDVVRARKGVSVKHKLSSNADEESEEGDDAVESAASKHKSAHDFLGMATVPIETFAHGKCMTADLPLLDENGIADDSTRPRGSLTVSVHWLHCEDEEEVAHGAKLWAVGAGGGRSLAVGKPTKPKPKPQLSDETAVEVLLLRNLMELLLQLLLNTATDALEPLRRLHKRLLEAQATGATADEAKVVEQRMDALLHSQLLPKLRLVRELAASGVGERLGIVTRKLREPVEDYITSFEQKARLDLRATVERSFGGLQVTTQLLQVQPPESVDCVAAMELAMAQRRRVSDWNDQLRQVLGTFFVGEGAAWRLPLEEQVAERYERLESIGSSPSGIVAAEISTRPATARPPPASTGVSTPVRPSTAATVAKRKDRIAKAKQQKRWYQM